MTEHELHTLSFTDFVTRILGQESLDLVASLKEQARIRSYTNAREMFFPVDRERFDEVLAEGNTMRIQTFLLLRGTSMQELVDEAAYEIKKSVYQRCQAYGS